MHWFSCCTLLLTMACFTVAFECYTCNTRKGRDCVDQKITCPGGVSSCSMAVFGSGQEVRVRKFCTSAGSTLYHYLLLFPGASFCQNMNVVSPPMRTHWSSDSPPAPPPQMMPSLLCVCTSPLCNGGHYTRVSSFCAGVTTEVWRSWLACANANPKPCVWHGGPRNQYNKFGFRMD